MAANTKTLKSKLIFRIVFQNNEVQTFVLDLNRIGQLFEKGIDGDGSIIGLYSQTTEALNPSKKAGTPYNFKDTGEFFESYVLKIYDDGFTIKADTIKEEDDLLDYSKTLLDLTNQSKNEIIKKIIPFIIQETRKIITG